MADHPARNERQDVFVFLGFVVLVVGVVAVVAVVQTDWPDRRWVALGAVAATVQAFAVAAALVVAWVQIRTTRAEGRRRRTDELIDRLQVLVFEDLLPAWSRVRQGWRASARHATEQVGAMDDVTDDDITRQAINKLLVEAYAADRKALQDARSAADLAAERTWRTATLLDQRPVALAQLQVAILGLPVHELPFRLGDPVSADLDPDDSCIADGDAAADELRRWMHNLTSDHVRLG